MILPDVNVLLYAYDKDSAFHDAASKWLETSLSSIDLFGLTWHTILAFVRITTNLRVFAKPLSGPEAIQIIANWFAQPNVTILAPGERHWEILSKMLTEGQACGPLVMDAHLAALAIEHGAVLHTTDRDFSRFPGLKVVNPLAQPAS